MRNPYLKSAAPSKEDLALTYLPKVKKIALHLASRLPDHISVDDLIQVGYIGLMESLERYDAKKEVRFSTFAEFRIRGAMMDELRSQDWTPRTVRDTGKKLDMAFKTLRSKGIDHPKDKQLAQALDIPLKKLPEFLDKAKPLSLLSLEGPGKNDPDDENSILESLSGTQDNTPEDEILRDEYKARLSKAIEQLTQREQMILSLYFFEEMNLKEIAATLSLTESRVSQIRTKSLSRLRSLLQE